MKKAITQKQLSKTVKIGDKVKFQGVGGVITYTITDILTTKSKAHKTKKVQYELDGYLKINAERIDSMAYAEEE